MSPAELARLTKITDGTISQYRNGKYEAAQKNLEKLSIILRVPIPWLMGVDMPIDIPTKPIFIKNISAIPEGKPIPLIGSIACGLPILADENIEEYITLTNETKANFCLRCKGDSMINDRIFDGDLVFIKQQPQVGYGEMAAIRIENEATLKRVYHYPDKVVLRASNPMYSDIILNGDDIEIIGKAVAFLSVLK